MPGSSCWRIAAAGRPPVGLRGVPYGPPLPSEWPHDAHNTLEFVVVRYPYHPLHGKRVQVVGHRTHHHESCLIVKTPLDTRQYLPAWMTKPSAENVSPVKHPILPLNALRHLSVYLTQIILSFPKDDHTPDQGKIHGRQRNHST